MRFLLALTLTLLHATAWSANYDVTLGATRTTIDGDTICSGVCQPGDTITLSSGTSAGGIYINDLVGADGNPIIIRNTSGAQTVIDTNDGSSEPSYGRAVYITNSKFIKIDGSNGYDVSAFDAINPTATSYGIRLTDSYQYGFLIVQDVSEIEICYVEIDNIGSASTVGIGIKENSKIDSTNIMPGVTFNGFKIHHNYIHDTKTEGIYIGATGSCSTNASCCNSSDDLDDAIRWTGIEIYENSLYNTGWDGISTGCGSSTIVRDNFIKDAGMANYAGVGQGCGLSLNVGFNGSVYANIIHGTEKQGISWQGVSGKTNIYNNLLIDIGRQASVLFPNERSAFSDSGIDTAQFNVFYNTVVGAGYAGITASATQPGLAQDNLFAELFKLEAGSNAYGAMTDDYPGVIFTDPADVNFSLSTTYDYNLTSSTPATVLDAGQTSYYPSTDILGTTRPYNTTPDIGAFEFNTPVLPFQWRVTTTISTMPMVTTRSQ